MTGPSFTICQVSGKWTQQPKCDCGHSSIPTINPTKPSTDGTATLTPTSTKTTRGPESESPTMVTSPATASSTDEKQEIQILVEILAQQRESTIQQRELFTQSVSDQRELLTQSLNQQRELLIQSLHQQRELLTQSVQQQTQMKTFLAAILAMVMMILLLAIVMMYLFYRKRNRLQYRYAS